VSIKPKHVRGYQERDLHKEDKHAAESREKRPHEPGVAVAGPGGRVGGLQDGPGEGGGRGRHGVGGDAPRRRERVHRAGRGGRRGGPLVRGGGGGDVRGGRHGPPDDAADAGGHSRRGRRGRGGRQRAALLRVAVADDGAAELGGDRGQGVEVADEGLREEAASGDLRGRVDERGPVGWGAEGEVGGGGGAGGGGGYGDVGEVGVGDVGGREGSAWVSVIEGAVWRAYRTTPLKVQVSVGKGVRSEAGAKMVTSLVEVTPSL
jgi:hypothetical protein